MTAALPLAVAGYTPEQITAHLGHPDAAHTAAVLRDELAGTRYAHLPEPWAVHLLRLDALAALAVAAAIAPHQPPRETEHARATLQAIHHERADALAAMLHRLHHERARQIGAARIEADKGAQISPPTTPPGGHP